MKRDNVVLFGEGQPPPETFSHSNVELLLAFLLLEGCDELDDVLQGARCSSVVWHTGNFTTELKHRKLLSFSKSNLFQDKHPLGLAKYVIIKGALRNSISGACLRESELLGNH